MEFNIKKSQVQVYKIIKNNGSGGWADITIDEGEKSGRLSISSDYGNWAYYWGSCGCSFKEFLCKVNLGYVAGKFGEDRWFDSEATINYYKKHILQIRRDGDMTQEQARIYFDSIVEIGEPRTENEFYHLFTQSALGENFHDVETFKRESPRFVRFWNTTWQAFREELQKELLVAV